MKSRTVTRRIIFSCLWILTYFTVLGAAVMLLWNALIPELFGGPVVTFIQSIGLLLLAHLLLRRGWSFGGFGWGHPYWRRKWWSASHRRHDDARGHGKKATADEQADAIRGPEDEDAIPRE